MNKLRKKILSLGISASLVLSVFPVYPGKVSTPAAVHTSTATAAAKPNLTDLRKKDSSSSYKKGEAVVFVRTAKKLTAKSKDFFGSGITIKNVLDFGTSKNSATAEELQQKVAVVSSDTYTTRQLVKKLKKVSGVIYAEPNYRFHTAGITADSYSDYQWSLNNTGQNGGIPGNDISVETGWQAAGSQAQTATSPPVVAVIDTGINLNHEDLKSHLWVNTNTRDLKGAHGYDFVNYDVDPSDDNGHGTHVAGIISASANNNAGISGVSPDVQIMALKFLDSEGSGYLEDALAAYNYIYCAQQLGVNVVAVNNSWGGETDSSYVSDIFTAVINLVGEQGAISVWAAGNESADNDTLYGLPASMSSPYLISVAASNENGELASYSNYGKSSVDLAAPGNNILSLSASPCYNPTIYDSEKQAQASFFYESFNSTSPTKDQYRITTGSVIDLSDYVSIPVYEKNYVSSGASVTTTAAGFGPASSGQTAEQALSLNLHDVTYGEIYNLAIPYEAPADTTDKASYSVSMMMKSGNIEKGSSLLLFALDVSQKPDGSYNLDTSISGYILQRTHDDNDYWTHLQFAVPKGIKAGDKRAVLLVAVPLNDASFELQFDDIGISNVIEYDRQMEVFGAYEFESGTSMAAPVVAGAVALAKQMHPDYSAKKLRAAVCGMVKPEENLRSKLRYGGILDFDYHDKLQPSLTEACISGNYLTLKGYFFGSAAGTLYINGVPADASLVTWSDETIQVADTSYLNHNVTFTVENACGSFSSTLFVCSADKAFSKTASSMELFEDGQMFSDGTDLYYMTESGFLYKYGEYYYMEDDHLYNDWFIISYLDAEELFYGTSDSFTLTMESEFLFLNHSIYGIVSYGTDYLKNYFIVCWDETQETWTIETPLPEDGGAGQYEYSTLAAYNSSLYLIGGYNTSNGSCSTMVRQYDIYTQKWSDAPPLPSGRYLSYGRQIGDRLYVTLGGNASGTVPPTAVYDGKTWTESAARLIPARASYLTYPVTEKTPYHETDEYSGSITYYNKIPYYEASVGISAKGLVYTGLACEGLGDVFFYDIATDSYETSPYSLYGIDNVISGTSAGSLYYLLSWDDMLSVESSLYSMPVDSANVTVYDNSGKGCSVAGAGTFLPGSTTVLFAWVKDGYTLKSFKVDGQKVSGFLSMVVTEDHTAKVTAARMIQSVKFTPKSVSVAAGHKITLRPVIKPKALSKKVRYSSSNKKVVTVSSKGVVKAKASAVGKKAKITVQTTDGSKKKATCIVRVTTPARSLSIRGGSSVKAGKSLRLTASTQPSAASNAVTWKSSNKRYATVTKKGVVKAKKAGKGKTVTITATTSDGTNIRKSVKIRIQ